MIHKRRLILSLDNVFLTGNVLQTREPISLTNEILGGELLVLKLEHLGQSVVIGDLVSGLISPSRGRIRFLGRDWSRIAPDIANGMRGKIGRVHTGSVWLEKLTIRENILMQQLHHTRRSVETVHAEAVRLAADLGLPGLPTGFPSEALPNDLQKAAWIRAFLGSPLLIVLEEPTSTWPSPDFPKLINMMFEARQRGAAVIWMTLQDPLWYDSSIPATRKFRLESHRLQEVDRT